jgi:hypothetical protein
MVTTAEVAEQKGRLPMGWGRFGKTLEHVIELAEPDEPLLAACVTLNPTFVHRSISLAGGLYEMTKSTNVVLAATDRRLILVATGMGGAPMNHQELSYLGLEISAVDKKELTLRWADGEARFNGAAKSMLAPFAAALAERIRSAAAGDAAS